MAMRSYVRVNGHNKFDFGFSVGQEKDQRVLRQVAADVEHMRLMGREKVRALAQFDLPGYDNSFDIIILYNDLAKLVAANLKLVENDDAYPVQSDDNTSDAVAVGG